MTASREVAAILGGGSFGTAMATILAENGHDARLWVRDPETVAAINEQRENTRYMPGQALPEGLLATESLEEALDGATLVFVALPSKAFADRKSTRLNSSHVRISYAVFCLKKK